MEFIGHWAVSALLGEPSALLSVDTATVPIVRKRVAHWATARSDNWALHTSSTSILASSEYADSPQHETRPGRAGLRRSCRTYRRRRPLVPGPPHRPRARPEPESRC